ncbi:MAG: condensation domain-containing protein, partial [Oscillospiraceae bacterium]|nr:condensation domain-containing protein [Oscillospiraceae bacterium]
MNGYALSHAQKRIWYTQRKYGDSPLFNIGGFIRIEGDADLCLLKEAINAVASRHDALRLRCAESAHEVYQYTVSDAIAVETIDLAGERDPEQALTDLCAQVFKAPFIMNGQPLYYFAVIRVGASVSGYLVKLHHIIADGWSMKLLTEQITACYASMIRKRPYNPEKAPSYLDYVKDEIDYVNSDACMRDRCFWADMFTPLPEVVIQAPANLDGNRVSYIPDDELAVRIQQFIKDHTVSLNDLFVFLYILYAYKRYGQDDCVLGTPLLGRSGKTGRRTIGTYTNPLPFRYRVRRKTTLMEMLADVAHSLRRSYKHQRYPYNLIQTDLQLRQNGIEKLYDVCVNCYNTVLPLSLGEMPVKNQEFYSGQQEYGLQIIIRQWDNVGFQLDYDYQTSKYTSGDIGRLHAQFMNLLRFVLQNGDQNVCDCMLVNQEEFELYTNVYNRTACTYTQKTMPVLFKEMSRLKPDAVALSRRDESMTYGALGAAVDRAACYLRNAGVRKGTLVLTIPDYDC